MAGQELFQFLMNLNSIIGNNLFISMTVCYRAYIIELIKVYKPAPYWGCND